MKLIKDHFALIAVLIALALGCFIGWVASGPHEQPLPTLSKQEIRAAKQEAYAAGKAAAAANARADTSRARAAAPYAAGKAAEQKALILHAQTHAKPKPTPVRTAAVDSLTRFFAEY